jgi:5-methylcytosine-specific restriction endonuclease McrA
MFLKEQTCYTELSDANEVSGSVFVFNCHSVYNSSVQHFPLVCVAATETREVLYAFKARMKLLQMFGEKRCVKCGETKPIDRFSIDKQMKSGRCSYCKDCRNNYAEKNRGKIIENKRTWQQKNPGKVYQYIQRFLRKHPGKRVEYRHTRRAREMGVGEMFTAEEWQSLKEYYNYTCLCCKRREPEIKLSPDHVKPLARGGSNLIGNIQPLCESCNQKKHAKHIDYRGLGEL